MPFREAAQCTRVRGHSHVDGDSEASWIRVLLWSEILRRFEMIERLVSQYPSAVVLAVVARLWPSPVVAGQESALDIPFGGNTIGTVEEIKIEPDSDDPSKLATRLTAQFPGFTGMLDRALRRRVNLNNGAHRTKRGRVVVRGRSGEES